MRIVGVKQTPFCTNLPLAETVWQRNGGLHRSRGIVAAGRAGTKC